jgi:exopolysaccharide production protein ExoQ
VPPVLALGLCVAFVACVLRYNAARSREVVTPTIWIPTLWLAINASRPVSFWLASVGIGGGPGTIEDGNLLDQVLYLSLIVLGLRALSIRGVAWDELFARNKWLVAFLILGGVSVLWSDFPLVTIKRLLRMGGNLVMVLLVLTDPQPISALKTVIRRCAYVLLPFSLLFIKYFPHLAVKYESWSGAVLMSGVASTKNMLGQLCLVAGLVLAWILLTQLKSRIDDLKEFAIDAFFFLLAVHLLLRVDSKTSLVCLAFGIGVWRASGISWVRERVGIVTLTVIGAFFLLNWTFGIVDAITFALGRDPTWTARTRIWDDLMAMNSSWILGTGYDTFWVGERVLEIAERFRINEAHNGYLEIILNLGIVGLVLFCGVILTAYANCVRRMTEPNYGRFAMAALLVAVVYNVTEAGFRGLSPIPFMFYCVGIHVPSVGDVATKVRPNDRDKGRRATQGARRTSSHGWNEEGPKH